jgi:hypothetical protein
LPPGPPRSSIPTFAVPLSIPPHVAPLIKLVRSGHRTGARPVH